MRSFAPLAPLALALATLPSPGLSAPLLSCALSPGGCASAPPAHTPITSTSVLFQIPSAGVGSSTFAGHQFGPGPETRVVPPVMRDENDSHANPDTLHVLLDRSPRLRKPLRPSRPSTSSGSSSGTNGGKTTVDRIIDGINAGSSVADTGADIAQAAIAAQEQAAAASMAAQAAAIDVTQPAISSSVTAVATQPLLSSTAQATILPAVSGSATPTLVATGGSGVVTQSTAIPLVPAVAK